MKKGVIPLPKINKCVRDSIFTIVILVIAFFMSVLFQNVFGVEEHITTLFVFAVFLVSLITEGYVYGLVAAFAGVIAVNYAFTFPYFKLNFTIPVNFISAVIMIIISVFTSALTTKLKHHDAIKAESEKERMRANLLRGISHDLRTPLTTIYGSSTTLLENANELTKEQQKKILVGIKEGTEWLIRMVENLLSITRIDSGDVKIIKTPIVLEELVDSVVLKFKKRYPEYVVNIEIPDEVVMIPMDAILIEQVLINILENAVQHAMNMTKLTFRVFTLGNKAIFEVEDNGCGISADRLPYIFEGYYQYKKDKADSNNKNAGIGLSVCATIIKAHGGDIKAENIKSGGAIFRFALDTEETEDDQQ